MANNEGQVASGSSDVRKGNMIFEAILDDGVFRFDCSVNDRDAAYPSVSFVNSKDRDTPITSTHKVPSYTPTFECLLEQQVVQLEVSCLFLVSGIRIFGCYLKMLVTF
jgi:alpha-glucosidase